MFMEHPEESLPCEEELEYASEEELEYPGEAEQLQSIQAADQQARDAMNSRFSSMTDEDIAALAQNGDAEAVEFLLSRFKNFVRMKAHSYFLVGADHEDIVQEGMIGLYKAIRDYQPKRQASFHAFAELCITRQIITAIKCATRRKHGPLNTYVSLNKPLYESDSDRTLLDILPEQHNENPEELVIDGNGMDDMLAGLSHLLTPLEMDALRAYLQGQSYQEIAETMGRSAKSVDNALQRVKHKLETRADPRQKGKTEKP